MTTCHFEECFHIVLHVRGHRGIRDSTFIILDYFEVGGGIGKTCN
jgi:hypothetical protein